MMFRVALFALTAATLSNGFVPRQCSIVRGGALPMASKTKEKVKEKKVEGKKAGADAPPVNLGWDSHTAVVSFVLF